MDIPLTTPTSRADPFPDELMHLLDTATHVIDEHVNDCGHCCHCGSVWPCRHAKLAEFALATL
jgi:hypothetical protein